jgi:hypothetical protein
MRQEAKGGGVDSATHSVRGAEAGAADSFEEGDTGADGDRDEEADRDADGVSAAALGAVPQATATTASSTTASERVLIWPVTTAESLETARHAA